MADNIFNASKAHIETTPRISIHKFGGSSLSSAKRIKNVCRIIQSSTAPEDIIVVSANGKVTDWLVALDNGFQTDNNSLVRENLAKLVDFYHPLVNQLLSNADDWLRNFHDDIRRFEYQKFNSDELLAFGEVWSARLLQDYLLQTQTPALFVDARELLKTDLSTANHQFQLNYFLRGLRRVRYGNYAKRLIVTGFIACNEKQETITLGRNGSDYTASILANLTDADSVTLWTDVAGIFNADPSIIETSEPIDYLSFSEAQALAAVGSNVLHPKTIRPLIEKSIKLFVRSSLQPEENGTIIDSFQENYHDNHIAIKSLALSQSLMQFKVKLNEHCSKHQLIKLLFDQHILALSQSFSLPSEEILLWIDSAKVDHTASLLTHFNLLFEKSSEPVTLISLVGSKVAFDRDLLKKVRLLLGSKIDYKLIPQLNSDSIWILLEPVQQLPIAKRLYQQLVLQKPVSSPKRSLQHELRREKVASNKAIEESFWQKKVAV